MTTGNVVEVTGMQAEIQTLNSRRSELQTSFQEAISEADASKLLSLGKEIQRVEDELETLEKRYARATGEAVPSVSDRTARELKELVLDVISVGLADINAKVREMWSLQELRKLYSIQLGFDFASPTEIPTVSLVSSKHSAAERLEQAQTAAAAQAEKNGRTPKVIGAPRTREVSKWLVDGEAVGRKGLIIRFGPEYGQTVMFDKMTPEQRLELSDTIAAGEGLSKV